MTTTAGAAASPSGRDRARPRAPEDRRRQILAAAQPLLLEHGRATTTRQIAEAAGIAEGTVFRVFATKEELFDAAVAAAFDSGPFVADLEALAERTRTARTPLRERLVELTELFQQRFTEIFRLMVAMSCARPPQVGRGEEVQAWRDRTRALVVEVLSDDAPAFRLPLDDVARLLRLITFSGTHPHISENRQLDPEVIVDLLLHGTLADPAHREES